MERRTHALRAVVSLVSLVVLALPAAAAAELPPGDHEVIAYAESVNPIAESAPVPGVVFALRPEGTDRTQLRLYGAPTLSGGDLVATVSRYQATSKPPGTPITTRLAVTRSDGTNSQYLVDARAPDFSPDAASILHVRQFGTFGPTPPGGFSGPGDLQLIPSTLEGTPSSLTATASVDEGEPSWFPSGQRIAFESNQDGGDYDVFAAAPDASGQVNLTPAGSDDELAPSVSPDGTRIVFSRRAAGGGQSDLWSMAADGSVPVQVTNTPDRSEADPVYSPDGSRIAFAATPAGSRRSDVYVAAADGSGEAALTASTQSGAQNPDWGRLTVLPPPPSCDGRLSTAVGTAGDDEIEAGTFGSILVTTGLGGDDNLRGTADGETLCGNGGDDLLRGNGGGDRLFGGAGADVLKGGPGFDRCFGVGRKDRASGCERTP